MKKICYVLTISKTVQSFFLKQMEYLSEHGWIVTVICSPCDDLKDKLSENIKYIPVNIERGVKPTTILKSILELERIFKTEQYDIIQYSTPNAAFCASIAAKLAGIKIRNYHMMGVRYLGNRGLSRYILKALEKTTCMFSSHIECISKSNYELCIKERLFKREKAEIVWNGSTGGVDLKRFDYEMRFEWRNLIRQKYGIAETDLLFGFVGRVTRDKGINEILEAFAYLNKDSNVKLLIIGSKEGIETIDKYKWDNACNDKRIITVDWVEDIEKYYAAIDVLLLPSYREGFGMVIAEAAAMGTPSIVSDIPGPIDVIEDKKTAFTVKVKDYESLKERMQYFIDHPDMAQEMSEACVNHIKNKFDSDVLCAKILERKEKLLS